MNYRKTEWRLAIVVLAFALLSRDVVGDDAAPKNELRAAMVAPAAVTADRVAALRSDGFNSIVLALTDSAPESHAVWRQAAERVRQASLSLGYWIEIARCPELADANPAWMASLQTHDEWRRFFPDTPRLAADQVAKTYPWVPVLAREPFTAQLARVKGILRDLPHADRVFLNDLQGAPSACGCGNALCRWTSDYGPRRTTTPLEDDAATLFVSEIQKLVPDSQVVPVWTTECEQRDGAKDGHCAGVGCFAGICWKAYTRQLMPLSRSCEQIGVLTPFRAMDRDDPVYGGTAGWVKHAVRSFQEIPPQRGGQAIPAARLITVLQGWDVSGDDMAAQIANSRSSGAAGYLMAFVKIEQDWQPKIVRWK